MIVVTGAAGFIGSCLVSFLRENEYHDLVLVDDFSHEAKRSNLRKHDDLQKVERTELMGWLDSNHIAVQFVYHIGARTDTTEFDTKIFDELNLHYSQTLWQKCVEYGLPLIYASSAATYGLGEKGYEDNHDVVSSLAPLNPYGISKNSFDEWALSQKRRPYFWVGLKFFNVYGPNEYHKSRMASVIYHAFHQARKNEKIKLFKSHKENYAHGEQKRDFIYVFDVLKVMFFFMLNRKEQLNGLYNLGTGKAETFNHLAESVFEALALPKNIEYIDTPEDIRGRYQYYTEANMKKLRSAGYTAEFYSLNEGIEDYVKKYLLAGKNY